MGRIEGEGKTNEINTFEFSVSSHLWEKGGEKRGKIRGEAQSSLQNVPVPRDGNCHSILIQSPDVVHVPSFLPSG